MATRKPFSIRLDVDLMREAKKKAIDRGLHLYQFIEEALQRALENQEASITDSGVLSSERQRQGKRDKLKE